jgi:methionyl-tRNA formyltransferase
MRAIVLTSDRLRHAYLAQVVASHFDLLAVIKERKGNYYATNRDTSPLIKEHFDALNDAELTWFGEARWPIVPELQLEKGQINSSDSLAWAISLKPDIVFLFGTSILNDDWLACFPQRVVNLHLGLSPYYRGSATLFWPLARNEPECVGATIHLAEHCVDAGRILARIKPMLAVGDDYYAINYKTIRQAIDALPGVVARYMHGEIEPVVQDLQAGNVYRKADFNENALVQALAALAGGLTRQQLDTMGASKKCNCS